MVDPETNGGTHPERGPGICRVQGFPTVIMLREPLDGTNWTLWRERMIRALRLCGVEGYAEGKMKRPENPQDADNWDYKDNYAQLLILNNISSTDVVHVGPCATANAMWVSLEAEHDPESSGHQTLPAVGRSLFRTVAGEGANISEHLYKLKIYWERFTSMSGNLGREPDTAFKIIIAISLPPSWYTFIEPYLPFNIGVGGTDPRKRIRSQEFIGILNEEYLRRKRTESANQDATSRRRLANRMAAATSASPDTYCTRRGRHHHNP